MGQTSPRLIQTLQGVSSVLFCCCFFFTSNGRQAGPSQISNRGIFVSGTGLKCPQNPAPRLVNWKRPECLCSS